MIKLIIDTNKIEMAEKMRENGMIYVVIAVLLIIFVGISIYLFYLDRKISKFENNYNKK